MWSGRLADAKPVRRGAIRVRQAGEAKHRQSEGTAAQQDDTRPVQQEEGDGTAQPSKERGGQGPQTPSSESAESTTHELPLDQVFEVLKNSRRRETLLYLRANDGEATLSDVAEHIAAMENDTTVQALSSTQRKRVYVGLYQCHLPKMDDMGVVDFDKNRGTIELEPVAEQLYTYLEEEDSRNWYRLYLAITAVAAGVFVLGLAAGLATGVTSAVVLVGLIVGISACSVVHSREESDVDSP